MLAACGSIMDSDKVNYKTNGSAKTVSLDIPPDLTQLTRDTRYSVPGGTITASGMSQKPATAVPTVAAKQVNDARVERDGKQRWLVINRPAEDVWPVVHEFWQENGFTYTVDQQQLGLLETEWAENRAKVPQDFIRRTIGKLFESFYSTGERDKFRTRIERNSTGGVDVFITHRGLSEEYTDQSKSRTIWQPRPSDPELEAEFLTRLMVKLGVSANNATTTATASLPAMTQSAIVQRGDLQVLAMSDSFDVAWRRVGLALDRSGFTVEDRDRAKGIYFVRYVDNSVEEKGFFSKLFSSTTPETGPVKYRVVIQNNMGKQEVALQNASGQTENSPATQRILKLLAEDLR